MSRHLTRQRRHENPPSFNDSPLVPIADGKLLLLCHHVTLIICVCVSYSRLVSTVHALIVGLFCLYILWFDDAVNANPVW